jgi:hypothetical protein
MRTSGNVSPEAKWKSWRTKSPSRGRVDSGAGAAPAFPAAIENSADTAQAEMNVRKCTVEFLIVIARR